MLPTLPFRYYSLHAFSTGAKAPDSYSSDDPYDSEIPFLRQASNRLDFHMAMANARCATSAAAFLVTMVPRMTTIIHEEVPVVSFHHYSSLAADDDELHSDSAAVLTAVRNANLFVISECAAYDSDCDWLVRSQNYCKIDLCPHLASYRHLLREC